MKDIIYPIFLKCNTSQDGFWNHIFENMAYGVFPSGVHIRKNCIYIQGKKKTTQIINIDVDNPNVFLEKIKQSMKSVLYLGSKKDIMMDRKIFYTAQNKMCNGFNDWSKIRKKCIRSILLDNYVSDLQKKHNLTTKDTRNILSILTMYINFNLITSKHIELDEKRIVNIKNVSFDPDTKVFKISNFPNTTSCKPVSKSNTLSKISLHEMWKKYSKCE